VLKSVVEDDQLAAEARGEAPRCARPGLGYKDESVTTVNGGVEVPSALVCQSYCRSLVGCKVFTYYVTSGGCWLQGLGSDKPKRLRIPGVWSGPASCADSLKLEKKLDDELRTLGSGAVLQELKSGKFWEAGTRNSELSTPPLGEKEREQGPEGLQQQQKQAESFQQEPERGLVLGFPDFPGEVPGSGGDPIPPKNAQSQAPGGGTAFWKALGTLSKRPDSMIAFVAALVGAGALLTSLLTFEGRRSRRVSAVSGGGRAAYERPSLQSPTREASSSPRASSRSRSPVPRMDRKPNPQLPWTSWQVNPYHGLHSPTNGGFVQGHPPSPFHEFSPHGAAPSRYSHMSPVPMSFSNPGTPTYRGPPPHALMPQLPLQAIQPQQRQFSGQIPLPHPFSSRQHPGTPTGPILPAPSPFHGQYGPPTPTGRTGPGIPPPTRTQCGPPTSARGAMDLTSSWHSHYSLPTPARGRTPMTPTGQGVGPPTAQFGGARSARSASPFRSGTPTAPPCLPRASSCSSIGSSVRASSVRTARVPPKFPQEPIQQRQPPYNMGPGRPPLLPR